MNIDFKLIFPCIILILVYVFMILDKIPRVVIALFGASLILLGKFITQEEAFNYIDFNVIFLLVGMMIIVNILGETGGLKWLAIFVAKKVNGSGVRLMVYFALITAVLSAMLDNVTTVILIGSITCTLTKSLKISPVPFLITEIIASNIGGTATLIGDPPNILIGSAAKLNFNQFIIHLTPIVLIILPVAIATLFLLYKDQLNIPKSSQKEFEAMTLKGIITYKSLLIKSLIVIALVTIGFFFHSSLKLEAGTIAIAGASILLIFENKKHIWDDVEWTTIFFFIGLFIIVGAVEETGTINHLSNLVLKISNGNFQILALSILWMSAFLSAIIDNIPYTATMIPLIKNMSSHYPNIQPLWWSLALGSCLGGNGTLIGASANIIVADMAHKQKYSITFIEFIKVGSLIMFESLIICTIYIQLRYL